jgi:hypothetical protein
MNSHLIRKSAGNKSRFAIDCELRAFLDTVDRYYTTSQLRALMVEHFGADRVPSRSSIHRYLQKITRRTSQEQGDNKHAER